MNYTQLNTFERNSIADYYGRGFRQSEIARILNRHRSSIGRELRRNKSGKVYNPAKAQSNAAKRKRRCGRKRKIERGNELYERIVEALETDLSPEQLTNVLVKNVSISTIYRAFHNKTLSHLHKHFRILTYKRGWRKGNKRGDSFRGCRKIEERPKAVFEREEFGHWELDSLVFCRKEEKVAGVFVERKTGDVNAVLLDDRKALTMKEAVVSIFKNLPLKARLTLTVDRGKEFELWRDIESELPGTRIYFCDAGSPYQKGCVENLNGLLRQYYPKNKNTKAPTPEHLAAVQARLNSRPRKRFNYATPYHLFQHELTKVLHLI
jgi:IS30 family transposase